MTTKKITLDQAFEALKEMNLTVGTEVQLINLMGALARGEYSEGCKETRKYFLNN